MSKVGLGKGLIWRTTDDGHSICDRQLSVAEVQARMARCWVHAGFESLQIHLKSLVHQLQTTDPRALGA